MSWCSEPSLLVEQKRVETIFKNKQTTLFWEEKLKTYEELQANLGHYESKLQEFVMVPIGKRGLMRGRLVNTNQVFVSIGGGWFTKVCSTDAQNLCGRRISDCKNMLLKLEKERKLLEGHTALSQNQVFATGFSKEIIEPYDEKEEILWRQEHSVKVKEHRKKLLEVQQQLEQNRAKDKQTEQELWRHLDLLELQEEFEDELDRLGENHHESDNSTASSLDSDDDSYEETYTLNQNSKLAELEKAKLFSDAPVTGKDVNISVTDSSQITNDCSKSESEVQSTHKSKNISKKVRFEEPPSVTLNEPPSKTSGNQEKPTVIFDQVIEHSVDLTKHCNLSRESKPLSKFKSSRMDKKKCS